MNIPIAHNKQGVSIMKYWYIMIYCYANVMLCSDASDHFSKGVTAFNNKDFVAAQEHFEIVNNLSPDIPDLLYNLASCYIKTEKKDDAILLLRRVIKLNPSSANAYIKLLELLPRNNKNEQLVEIRTSFLQHCHNNYEAHIAFARYYKDIEQFDLCIEHYKKVMKIRPHDLISHFELAIAYTIIGQTEEAIKLYDTILGFNPNNAPVIYNKGYALKMQGSCDQAIACYKEVLRIDPDYDAAHFALGMAYLSKGDFEQGWKQHARFLKQVDRNGDQLRSFLADETTQGKTILLRPEGGLGDSINFIRYAQELKKYGCNVVVAVPKSLYTLFRNCPGIDLLLKVGEPLRCHIDDHTTLMSIPAILYSHEHTLPEFRPYIFPDQELIDYWHEQLKDDTNFKIGICWEASVYNDSSRPPVARRGMPLETLYILSEIEGISLYSLQQHDGVEQLKNLPSHVTIHQFDETFDKAHGSFMDTAAVMHNMDLIISVDTAIAHLAGAMGRPVWLMLPYATDWRWIAHETRSPWYPTMQIFQQPKPFDWKSVVSDIFWNLVDMVNREQ
jgi:tetratricopeptide (TPR) repeat protein